MKLSILALGLILKTTFVFSTIFSPFLSKFSWGHKLFFWNVLLELMFCRCVHLATFSYYPWIDTENRDPVLPQGCQTNSPFLNIFAKATLYFESSKNFSSFAKIFPMRSKFQKIQFLVSHDNIYPEMIFFSARNIGHAFFLQLQRFFSMKFIW